LIGELRPQHIFEFGSFGGGSALFFAELARPRRLVTIDRLPLPQVRRRVERYAASRGFGDVVRTFGEVDQADRQRLAQIVEEEFDGSALDLVVDDCSHLYAATRASFNELFPRLRPGGAYVIEDWRWAHTPVGEQPLEGLFPDQVPLTRLLFEIVLALPGIPDLITEISVQRELILVKRGDAKVDSGTFDVSASSNPRGQALLAPD
jgi:SAM-dependent methyltransferase